MSRPLPFVVEWESLRLIRANHARGIRRNTHAGRIADCLGCSDEDPSFANCAREFKGLRTATLFARSLIARDRAGWVQLVERVGIKEDKNARGLWDWDDHYIDLPDDLEAAVMARLAAGREALA